MSLHSRILSDKKIDGSFLQPFQIFFQEIIGDHVHGLVFSKLLQSLADTLHTMTSDIDTGKFRVKLQKLFHNLGCHPLIIIGIPDIHNFDSWKALFDFCRKTFLSADQAGIGNLSGNNGNLSHSAGHLPHQTCCCAAGLKRILSHKAQTLRIFQIRIKGNYRNPIFFLILVDPCFQKLVFRWCQGNPVETFFPEFFHCSHYLFRFYAFDLIDLYRSAKTLHFFFRFQNSF